MGTGRRFWRWRRNPLKRGSDRLEACTLLLSGLLLVGGTPAAGVETGLAVMAHADRPPADWKQVSAVVTHKAPPPTPITGIDSGGNQVRATVRWHVSGHEHTGEALVAPNTPAGTHTTIWLDSSGTVRPNPVDSLSGRSDAIAYGILVGCGTALFACGGRAAALSALNRRRAADLTREWALVGPEWRRHRT
ncbi:hypothetical protein SAMN05216223_118118 [Actinacidiphila yanglinensis]|uniref:Uncharacterized protein n=1 Tax=Actinacidiphila yanglinensis TaxID=310779 RepID=A0A1H6DQC3_9ACTN|nr:hypothetical protein [Actinacidiphila yanglinensis]SEG87567.1 hypothetical protein SAMN05216223_118118 [Actinacidiphila yanglinensis]